MYLSMVVLPAPGAPMMARLRYAERSSEIDVGMLDSPVLGSKSSTALIPLRLELDCLRKNSVSNASVSGGDWASKSGLFASSARCADRLDLPSGVNMNLTMSLCSSGGGVHMV